MADGLGSILHSEVATGWKQKFQSSVPGLNFSALGAGGLHGRWFRLCSAPWGRLQVETEVPKFCSWSLDQAGRRVCPACPLCRDFTAPWPSISPTHHSLNLRSWWSTSQMCRALLCALKSMLGGNRSSKVLFLVPGSGRSEGVLHMCTPQRSLCSLAAQISHSPVSQPLGAGRLCGRWAGLCSAP